MKSDRIRRSLISIYLVFVLFLTGFMGLLIIDEVMDTEIFKVRAAQTIVVDDDGTPGVDCNYTVIQWAIDNASSGDTIYVWAGVYHENVVINKSVTLIGNGTINTTIDGGTGGDNVLITTDWVNISGFTITNSSGSGIGLDSVQHCRIEYNNISSNNGTGIWLVNSTYNMIK